MYILLQNGLFTDAICGILRHILYAVFVRTKIVFFHPEHRENKIFFQNIYGSAVTRCENAAVSNI